MPASMTLHLELTLQAHPNTVQKAHITIEQKGKCKFCDHCRLKLIVLAEQDLVLSSYAPLSVSYIQGLLQFYLLMSRSFDDFLSANITIMQYKLSDVSIAQ